MKNLGIMRWLFASLSVACASPWQPVGLVLREGRNNDFAATQKYRGQTLQLAGIVAGFGKKKIEHGEGRTEGRWADVPAEGFDAARAFVQIRDAEKPSPDVVTCFFDGDIQAPERGATVRVRGTFVEYVGAAGHVDAVFTRCSLE
jgi:hypothetical protein